MFVVMSNSTDIITVVETEVSYHESFGFEKQSVHESYGQANSAAEALEYK